MSGNIYSINVARTQSLQAASQIPSTQPVSTGVQPNTVASATFGAAVDASSNYTTGVKAIARQYPDFDSALLPMVRAAGVPSEAAEQVATAIQKNPGLRAQAERAYNQALAS